MKKLLIVLATWNLLACNNTTTEPGREETKDNEDIFPVTSFLAGQINMVDSLQLPVMKFTSANNITDTVLLSIDEFKALAKEFLQPDVSDPSIKKHYKETSFADQSIPSVTLTYSTPDKDLEIQRLDVIINPNPEFNDRVNTIYMEKIQHRDDTLIIKKLYWKTNKNFQIITSKQAGDQPAVNSHTTVSWDQSED